MKRTIEDVDRFFVDVGARITNSRPLILRH